MRNLRRGEVPYTRHGDARTAHSHADERAFTRLATPGLDHGAAPADAGDDELTKELGQVLASASTWLVSGELGAQSDGGSGERLADRAVLLGVLSRRREAVGI